jgi:hypothetical protein
MGRDLQASISVYDALALIPTERAAFSYQPNDLKSVCRGVRRRFLFDAVLGREPTDLVSTFRDAFRFKLVSLGEKRSFLWRHWGIKSIARGCVKCCFGLLGR